MKTRACGHMHPEGLPCLKPVLYEEGCCVEKTYDHDGPHEHVNKEGLITHRWEEVLQVIDLPYDAYKPWTEEDVKKAETNGAVMA